MKLFLIIALFLFSCVDHKTQVEENSELIQKIEESENLDISKNEYWVCHHPETDFHNQECVEESYPNGCYVNGDSGKFCWLLYREDCEKPIKDSLKEPCKNLGLLRQK